MTEYSTAEYTSHINIPFVIKSKDGIVIKSLKLIRNYHYFLKFIVSGWNIEDGFETIVSTLVLSALGSFLCEYFKAITAAVLLSFIMIPCQLLIEYTTIIIIERYHKLVASQESISAVLPSIDEQADYLGLLEGIKSEWQTISPESTSALWPQRTGIFKGITKHFKFKHLI